MALANRQFYLKIEWKILRKSRILPFLIIRIRAGLTLLDIFFCFFLFCETHQAFYISYKNYPNFLLLDIFDFEVKVIILKRFRVAPSSRAFDFKKLIKEGSRLLNAN